MGKGVTNAPLVIWVAEQWYAHPAVLDLMRAGHTVVKMQGDSVPGPDLILHPAAHQWRDELFDYLPAALTAARRRRRERK